MSVDGEPSRRTVLLGAGALGAAGVLAACGGDDPSGPPSTAPGGGGTSPGPDTTTEGAALDGIPVAQIPVGGGHIDFTRRVVVTQPEAGEFRAFEANCTHERCLITWVEDGLIHCPCHGSQFRIADGSVARGPATQPLPTRAITVDGDVIVIA
jgi:Rieske Fe-S protein